MGFFVKKVDSRQKAIEESVRHQVLSEFTAFVCVEKVLADGEYQRVKDIGFAQALLGQPSPPSKKERAKEQLMAQYLNCNQFQIYHQ